MSNNHFRTLKTISLINYYFFTFLKVPRRHPSRCRPGQQEVRHPADLGPGEPARGLEVQGRRHRERENSHALHFPRDI